MDFMQIFELITGLLSGIALFIFGMNTMSGVLTQIAGGNLSGRISRIAEKRISGWAFGTTLAALVQSSATTVMIVGLVNSGIMKAAQAAPVMIGANLGTTATAWLLSLNSLGGPVWLQLLTPSSIIPFLAMGGIICLMVANTDKKRSIGNLIVGFSVMMIGMDLMSSAVAPLEDVPAFKEMLFKFSNPVLGVAVGILCTFLIQSSAATIGILQALSMSVGVSLGMAVPIVCGAQLGTCLTAILASMGSSNKGKRAALIHLFYNLIRNTLFMVILYAVNALTGNVILNVRTSAVRIAAFHTMINIVGSALFLPMTGLLIKLIMKVLPYNMSEQQEEADTLTILDKLFLSNPSFALDQVRTGTDMLAELVREYFARAMSDDPASGQAQETERISQKALRYAKQLRDYCIEISEKHMNEADARNLAFLQSTVNDYAEICEKTKLMKTTAVEFLKEGGQFSEEALRDLRLFGTAAQDILETTVSEYELQNVRLATTIQVYREVITDISGKLSNRNVRRLHSGDCNPQSNRVFSELCNVLELVIDRCDSIATHILIYAGEDKAPAPDEEKYNKVRKLFEDKYSALDE